MIIVDTPSVRTRVLVMKIYHDIVSSTYFMTLKNRTTNQVYNFEVTDTMDYEDYYCFYMDLSALPYDEYEYTLDDSNDKRMSTGIMQLGLVHYKGKTEYKAEKTYTFYEDEH